MTTEERRKTLIGDILEYKIYEEADLAPLSFYELVVTLQKLMNGIVNK